MHLCWLLAKLASGTENEQRKSLSDVLAEKAALPIQLIMGILSFLKSLSFSMVHLGPRGIREGGFKTWSGS